MYLFHVTCCTTCCTCSVDPNGSCICTWVLITCLVVKYYSSIGYKVLLNRYANCVLKSESKPLPKWAPKVSLKLVPHAHVCVVRGKLGICTRTGTIVPVWVL